MITYAYWFGVFGLALAILGLLGVRMKSWKTASGLSLAVLLAGWVAYSFHFQQLFVKRWGGVMSIRVPKGQMHMGATWKDENLWIENYDPATNTCHFSEYSKGNLLEGRVAIKDCNPLAGRSSNAAQRTSRRSPGEAATMPALGSGMSGR